MSPREDSKELVERFYRRISMPYLTEIEIDWGGLAVTDTRPAALPDLSALQLLVLHGRYARGGEADITIRGKVAGRPHAQKLHVVLPAVEARNAAISRLWARETIADLERKPRGVPVDAEAITRIALSHDLMSKYTAFIAADSSGPKGANGAPRLVSQPSEAPEDVDLQSAGGVVGYGGAPPAPPRGDYAAHQVALAEAAPHRGGCAGCSSAPTSGTRPALGTLLALVLVVARRRSIR
jgi:Ca-activated chloride channel homolog